VEEISIENSKQALSKSDLLPETVVRAHVRGHMETVAGGLMQRARTGAPSEAKSGMKDITQLFKPKQ
jgi:hypothetical protein